MRKRGESGRSCRSSESLSPLSVVTLLTPLRTSVSSDLDLSRRAHLRKPAQPVSKLRVERNRAAAYTWSTDPTRSLSVSLPAVAMASTAARQPSTKQARKSRTSETKHRVSLSGI